MVLRLFGQREAPQEGKIVCRAIIEMLGAPEAHLRQTFSAYLARLASESGIELRSQKLSEPKAQEKLFMMFAELELGFKDPRALLNFCFGYMPASIEIVSPARLELTSQELTSWLNDVQARLHKLDALTKALRLENAKLNRNAAAILRNNIMLVLREKSLELGALARRIGIPEDKAAPFIKALVKQGWLKRKGKLYALARR